MDLPTKWWFSIVMLVYQRVNLKRNHFFGVPWEDNQGASVFSWWILLWWKKTWCSNEHGQFWKIHETCHVRPPNASLTQSLTYTAYVYIHIWLVVSNMVLFSISYMGCHPTKLTLTFIFFRGVETTNQYCIIFHLYRYTSSHVVFMCI